MSCACYAHDMNGETETAVETPAKLRKQRKTITLDREAEALAAELAREDHRPSLVNTLEWLIFEEAKRRGLYRPTEEGAK
jgi:hypothetical protein